MAKEFLIKVYDPSGNFITTWDDVISEPNYSTEINSPASELVIELGRDPLNFGEEVDIDFNNIVKVYVGDRESNYDLYFQGYIADYSPIFGDNKVEVIVFSYGAELDSYILGADETGDQIQLTGTSEISLGGGKLIAQSFIPDVATHTSVEVKMVTTIPVEVIMSIQTNSGSNPSGSAVSGSTVSKTITNTTAEYVRFTFENPISLTIGTTYWVVMG